jgi:hypothetical protein
VRSSLFSLPEIIQEALCDTCEAASATMRREIFGDWVRGWSWGMDMALWGGHRRTML